MTIPLDGYPSYRPYSNITPFTFRDGATYLLQLEALKDWIRDSLVPFLDSEVGGLTDDWKTLTTQLLDDFNVKTEALQVLVTDAVAGMTNQVALAEAAQQAAEAARDLASIYASDAANIQDTAISGILADTGSAFRLALDGLFPTAADFSAFQGDVNDSITAVNATVDGVTSDVATINAELDGRLSDAGISEIAASSASVMRANALSARSQSDFNNSFADSLIGYEDADGFAELWEDFTNWSDTDSMLISDGRLYGNGKGGSSGINRALVSPGFARAVFQIRSVSGGSSGGVIIGFSSSIPDSVPADGGVQARGVYFLSNGEVRTFDKGASGGFMTTAGTVDWTVTITADADRINVSLYSEEYGEAYAAHARGTEEINNVFVFNSDSRGIAGSSIGPVGARNDTVTVVPRTGIEGVQRTVHRTIVNNDKFRIALPTNYDSRRPSPAIILFHGNGTDEYAWTTNANMKAVAEAFLNAGFICLSATAANTTTWGSDASLNAYANGYNYLKENYAISSVSIYANSMGSIESLLTLSQDRIPGVAAWVGTSPTFDLLNNYNNPLFTSVIKSAYGIAVDGSDYASLTEGHDPALINPLRFRSIPMLALVPTDDTSVNATANGLALASKLDPVTDFTLVTVTGGHSTVEIANRASEFVAFVKDSLGI